MENREIKFRAWKDGMLSGFVILGTNQIAFTYLDKLEKIVNDVKLMQYTGLKDKNGVEYCQDDIVKYKDKNYRLIKGSYMFELVGFYETSQDIPSDFFSEKAYLNAEVIGNIYENPNLLK